MKKIFYILICLIFFIGCKNVQTNKDEDQKTLQEDFETENIDKHIETDEIQVNDLEDEINQKIKFIDPSGITLKERFFLPSGFTRYTTEEGSFEQYLQNIKLKPNGVKVKYYDGREKNNNIYLAVVDFDLGDRDLQQCADSIIRLRAEYFYQKEEYDKIKFNFVNGFRADFGKWKEGYGISVEGNNTSWYRNTKNDSSYESFQKYLNMVYAFASTISLDAELVKKDLNNLDIGDVFIKPGSPGHCVIVMDVATNNKTKEKIFILAQSYMPAQDIQILKGSYKGYENSPWFLADFTDILVTPEYTFNLESSFKTWQ